MFKNMSKYQHISFTKIHRDSFQNFSFQFDLHLFLFYRYIQYVQTISNNRLSKISDIIYAFESLKIRCVLN